MKFEMINLRACRLLNFSHDWSHLNGGYLTWTSCERYCTYLAPKSNRLLGELSNCMLGLCNALQSRTIPIQTNLSQHPIALRPQRPNPPSKPRTTSCMQIHAKLTSLIPQEADQLALQNVLVRRVQDPAVKRKGEMEWKSIRSFMHGMHACICIFMELQTQITGKVPSR